MNKKALKVPTNFSILQLIYSGIGKTTFWIYYAEGHFFNKKIHVRAVLDEDIIVFREWSKKKKFWRYHTENIYYFQCLIENGHLYTSKIRD